MLELFIPMAPFPPYLPAWRILFSAEHVEVKDQFSILNRWRVGWVGKREKRKCLKLYN